MNLKLILIIIFALGAVLYSNQGAIGRKRYISWCSFFILISVSLKCSTYGILGGGGADTLSYIHTYKSICNMSFQEIWNSFLDRYVYHTGSEEDEGFFLMQWVVSRFTDKYHIFSTVADLLFYIPFAKILDRYCGSILELLFAFLLYLALFHTFAMFGARQFFAMGCGLISFLCYSEKKYIKALVALLFGITLHMSLLLILVPFVLSFFPGKALKSVHGVSLLLVPIVMLLANPIISFMGDFVGIDKYASYGKGESRGGATTYIVLSSVLSFLCLILTNEKNFQDDKFKYIYAMAPVFTFFAPLIYSNGTMIRITIYSQIFVTVLLPYLCRRRLTNEDSTRLLSIMGVALVILMLKDGYYPYEFFWNVDSPSLW